MEGANLTDNHSGSHQPAVRDLEASLGFYRDALGLEPFGLDEHRRGGCPLVSLRVTEDSIRHLTSDPAVERAPTGGYDHLAPVVEDEGPDELAEHPQSRNVEVEKRFESITGARAGRDRSSTSEIPTAIA